MKQLLTIKDLSAEDKSYNTASFWANILIGLSPIWLSTLFIIILRKNELLNSVIQGELAIYNISTLFVLMYSMLNKQKNTVFDKVYELFFNQNMIRFEKPEVPQKNTLSVILPLLIIMSMALYAIEKLDSLQVLNVKIGLALLNWLTFGIFLSTAFSSYITGLFENINPFKDSLFKQTSEALTYYREEKEERKKIIAAQKKLSSGRAKKEKKFVDSFEKELRNQSKSRK